MTTNTFKYADLFAGVGGFAATLSAMGGEHAYAVEIDPAAAAVYTRNWGHNPLGDVTKDATETVMRVPEHDILVGGFPCQPFSKSGAQRGMDETRGTLFFNIMQIVRLRRPTVVVLENVRNLVGPRHTHEWAVIIEQLRAAGYQVSDRPAIVSPHQIAPSHGGAPQVRERVFITATLVPDDQVGDVHVNPIALPAPARKEGDWDLARPTARRLPRRPRYSALQGRATLDRALGQVGPEAPRDARVRCRCHRGTGSAPARVPYLGQRLDVGPG